MLIEIAGARLINPYFGVGIYVWAALISVTLGGLALGYWIGGIIADKRPSWSFFYIIVLYFREDSWILMVKIKFVVSKSPIKNSDFIYIAIEYVSK